MAIIGIVFGLAMIGSFVHDPIKAETMAGGAFSIALGLGLLALAIMLYLLPTYIASKRKHRNILAILLLNLLLGWTLIGWAGALIWSVYEEKR